MRGEACLSAFESTLLTGPAVEGKTSQCLSKLAKRGAGPRKGLIRWIAERIKRFHGLKRVLAMAPPGLLLELRIYLGGRPEPEMMLLGELCSRDRISLDIGAHMGSYTYLLAKYSAKCVAFEPLPPLAVKLRGNLELHKGAIEFHAIALSDESGTAVIRAPKGYLGWATIDPNNDVEQNLRVTYDDKVEAKLVEYNIPTRTLDSFNFKNIGFMKIDVEGHELGVLRGAEVTIERDRPVFLIEIEERHNPGYAKDIFKFLVDRNYVVRFVFGGELRNISEFATNVHQDVGAIREKRRYVSNFIMIPAERQRVLEPQLRNKIRKMNLG